MGDSFKANFVGPRPRPCTRLALPPVGFCNCQQRPSGSDHGLCGARSDACCKAVSTVPTYILVRTGTTSIGRRIPPSTLSPSDVRVGRVDTLETRGLFRHLKTRTGLWENMSRSIFFRDVHVVLRSVGCDHDQNPREMCTSD